MSEVIQLKKNESTKGVDDNGENCGACVHARAAKVGAQVGVRICHALPPTLHLVPQQTIQGMSMGQMVLRPIVQQTDPACSLFKLAPSLIN